MKKYTAELIAPHVAYVYYPNGHIFCILDDTCFAPGGANEGDKEPRSDWVILKDAEFVADAINANMMD